MGNSAEVEAALGNDLRANEFFCLAMEVDPTDAATAFKYAIFYDHAMQLDQAEQWYLRALSLVKKFHRVPVMLSTYADFILTERRNVTVARQLYERILAAAPDHSQALHNLAVLLYEADPQRAKGLFIKALENAEDESRIAVIARSCAMFHLSIQETSAGMEFYQKYKERKELIAVHPPTLYHATVCLFFVSSVIAVFLILDSEISIWTRNARDSRDFGSNKPVQGAAHFLGRH